MRHPDTPPSPCWLGRHGAQGENYTGEGDPSQDSLVFLLQTEAARAKQGAAAGPAPYLPTGTVIGGLLAAVLSYCQVRSNSCYDTDPPPPVGAQLVTGQRAVLFSSGAVCAQQGTNCGRLPQPVLHDAQTC